MKEEFTLKLDKVLTLGADKKMNKNDLKKVKVFNVACITWYFVALFLVFFETPDYKYFFNIANITHLVFIVFVALLQFIHYKKQRITAYFSYMILLFIIVYLFANYLIVGELLEYYYIAITPLSFIFLDNKKLIYIILILSLLAFYIPNKVYNYYPDENFSNLSQPILLIIIFISTYYFKTLNTRNEKSLENKTKELEELNSFKSQFFTNISHEIRTPIALIKGYNDALPELYNKQEEVNEIHLKINNQVHKITEMVNSVLDLAKLKESKITLNVKPTNLSELINRLYINFEPLFKQKNIELLLQLKNKKCIANIDTIFLERALNNIIINALKYTENGKVLISVNCKEKITEIIIKDTGIGINKKDIKKIFDRFYQADNDINQSGGSGVGLAFSKEIIELHGGRITVKSALNTGSEFIIQLPVSDKKEKNLVTEPLKNNQTNIEASNDISFSETTFLIVDDNVEMRQYLKKILQQYKCVEAENGEEALKILRQEKINFIITDYMMPKMNGYDFIERVKNDNYTIPIIMLTAKADIASKLKVLELGIDDYLTKPFDKNELLLRIKSSLKNFTKRDDYINGSTTKINIPSNNFIEELKKFIIKNSHNQDLSQEDIADYFNISKSSLYRKLKSKTGLSPSEFVTEVKLLKARNIIENNPDILLKQLVSEVGFKHISYFSNLFEKRFGRKPTKS